MTLEELLIKRMEWRKGVAPTPREAIELVDKMLALHAEMDLLREELEKMYVERDRKDPTILEALQSRVRTASRV